MERKHNYSKTEDGRYVDLEYTLFPAEVDSWVNSEDVSVNMLGPSNQYLAAMSTGRYSDAQTILANYPRLKNMIINADLMNKIKHATMALERMFTEDIETYIKQFTDLAKSSADKAVSSADIASKASKTATAARDESQSLVSTLRTLKGTLPSDFTEYVKELAGMREFFTGKLNEHNTSGVAHDDIRKAITKLQTNVVKHNHSAAEITSGALPVSRGGTGGQNPAQACSGIGALSTSGGMMTGTMYFGSPTYWIDASGNANFKKAYGAVYNDYAELFPRGEITEPGDIIALDLNSKSERYIRSSSLSRRIVGVHTDEYAFLIGGDPVVNPKEFLNKNLKKYIPVSLAGRVMTKVIGPIRTGDLIVPSEYPGVGRAVEEGENVASELIVGYAVESDDRADMRRIRVRIGR